MKPHVAERVPSSQDSQSSASNPQSAARKASHSEQDRSNGTVKVPFTKSESRRKDTNSSRRGSQAISIAESSDVNARKQSSSSSSKEVRRSSASGVLISSQLNEADQQDPSPREEADSTLNQPFPFPDRPDSKFRHRRMTASSLGSGQWDIRPQNESPTSEAPLCAPRFTKKKRGDFCPWIGHHPEDTLSVESIKYGFSDKQVLGNEYQTARATLWPVIKTKGGLQLISTLHASVLKERQSGGRIHTPTTFKPPPRVTLTDTKREAWLRDLGDESVSLRRLSRTIPHGIRGKSLLEQCLHKGISVERGVWLAKCVGANEIRAFRRKGIGSSVAIGGELKWIREWTIQVEQFLDSVIATCGEAQWRQSMTYALRFSALLFAEKLVDRDHFLEWLLSFVSSSSLDTFPISLLFIEMYWPDLLQSRRTACRLAEGLLGKMRTVSAQNRSISQAVTSVDTALYAPITDQLSRLITKLMTSCPNALISPRIWPGHNLPDTLNSTNINERNESLVNLGPTRSVRQETLQLLDSLCCGSSWRRIWPVISALGRLEEVVSTTLDWLSSPYRQGPMRVFVAARLLRKCSSRGVDVGRLFFESLRKGLDDGDLFHLLSELVRSSTFSVANYLQWLIARGGVGGFESNVCEHGSLRGLADAQQELPESLRLLTQIPITCLSQRVRNLRQVLLENFLDTDAETAVISKIQTQIERSLSNAETLLSSSSRTVKAEIGFWVRQQVQSTVHGDASASISPKEFCYLRSILEDTHDYSVLADVLTLLSSADQPELCASLVDTLTHHFEIFEMIGAAKPCMDRFLTRYRTSHKTSEAMVQSLLDACTKFPQLADTAKRLRQDLCQHRQATAVSACSPVSDSAEDMEKALSSGTSIDKPTLTRLFEALSCRIEESWQESKPSNPDTMLLLAKLRTSESDELLSAWLSKVLGMARRPLLVVVLPPLVEAGCVDIGQVIQSAKEFLAHSADDPLPLIVEVLEFLAAVGSAGSNPDEYRLSTQVQNCLRDRVWDVLGLVSSVANSADLDPLLQTLSKSPLRTVLCDIATEEPGRVLDQLCATRTPDEMECVSRIIAQLFPWSASPSFASDTLEEQVEIIMRQADEFSAPYCQMMLRVILLAHGPSHHQQFASALLRDVARVNSPAVLTDLIGSLGEETGSQICHLAHSSLLGMLSSTLLIDTAKTYLAIIEATNSTMNESEISKKAAGVAESLDQFYAYLTNATIQQQKNQDLEFRLYVLLRLTVIWRLNPRYQQKAGKDHALVVTLCNILLSKVIQDHSDMTTYCFDIISVLVDDLSEESRVSATQLLQGRSHEARIKYLLGIRDIPGQGLMVSQRGKFSQFVLRPWETLSEPTPNFAENDTSISLTLFQARRS